MIKEDLLDKKEYFNNLYDLYKDLFTSKQKEYFESYFFDDMSLSEIANINEVSRNAVFLSLKGIQTSLEEYENKLHLFEHKNNLNSLIDSYKESKNEEVVELIKKLIEMES